MEKLARELAKMMAERGLSLPDTKLAIGLLDTMEDFLKMKEELELMEALDRRTALELALKITA